MVCSASLRIVILGALLPPSLVSSERYPEPSGICKWGNPAHETNCRERLGGGLDWCAAHYPPTNHTSRTAPPAPHQPQSMHGRRRGRGTVRWSAHAANSTAHAHPSHDKTKCTPADLGGPDKLWDCPDKDVARRAGNVCSGFPTYNGGWPLSKLRWDSEDEFYECQSANDGDYCQRWLTIEDGLDEWEAWRREQAPGAGGKGVAHPICGSALTSTTPQGGCVHG